MAKSSIGLSIPVYNHILQLIMTKQLLPNDRIPETKIAQDFNISRTPVRDAMRQLANEGLLEIYPNRYAQVKEYSPESITEIGVLRVALDTLSIKLAALYGSKADFLHLADIAKQCEDAYTKNDSVRKKQLDCDFHLALSEISNNELLIKYQKELYLRVQYIMVCHPNTVDNEVLHIQQHHQIADALMNNDEPKALSIIVNHLTSFYNLKEKYPDDFFRTLEL